MKHYITDNHVMIRCHCLLTRDHRMVEAAHTIADLSEADSLALLATQMSDDEIRELLNGGNTNV